MNKFCKEWYQTQLLRISNKPGIILFIKSHDNFSANGTFLHPNSLDQILLILNFAVANLTCDGFCKIN